MGTMAERARPRRLRRKYSAEFKANAVRLALDERRGVAAVARELDLSDSVLATWVQHAQAERTQGQSGLVKTEREELARLRKENRILAEEVEILKKATAFFAKRSR